MQVPDEIRQCVAVLACRRNSGYKINGTVFFVGYPLGGVDGSLAPYAVTARHVIEEINEHGNDGTVYCRMNTRQAGVQFVSIPISRWVFNDDPRVDVAVSFFPIDSSQFAHKVVFVDMFISPEIIASEEVGPGDDVFFPGLFSRYPGEKANIPIIRVGNIAAMPAEPIQTQWGWLQPPYLVEARSIGGLSGSPVFWYRGASRMKSGGVKFGPGPLFSLLGLVHGHYEEKELPWDGSENPLSDVSKSRSVNMGIAMVVPASDIMATLDKPDLKQNREDLRQTVLALKRLQLVVPDAAPARTEDAPGLSTSFSTDTLGGSIQDNGPPMNP